MQKININILKNYVEYLASKDVSGGYIPPDRWNEMVPILVNKIVRKYYGLPEEYIPGMPMPKITFESTQLVIDYISQLKEEAVIEVPSNGKITKPADYLHKSSAVVTTMKKNEIEEQGITADNCLCSQTTQTKKNKPATYTTQWGPVTFVPDEERWMWLKSSLRKPTIENPIGCFLGNDEVIFYPNEIKSVIFVYVRYPAKPVWNYTGVDGVPIYDPVGSVDVELPEICADELAVTILERLGIAIREPALVDWSRYVKNSGK